MSQEQLFPDDVKGPFLKVTVVSIHDEKVTSDIRFIDESGEALKTWSTVQHAVPEGKALVANFGRLYLDL